MCNEQRFSESGASLGAARCKEFVALKEVNAKLREGLEFYAKDDANAVECGILGSVDDRPATNALKEVG